MTTLYLDTNIFLYLADKKSPFHEACKELIEYVHKEKILLVTSTETIQEIVHYAKNIRQLGKGLEIAKIILQLVDELLSVDREVIDKYLKLTKKYRKIKSRDIIHLATALKNSLNTIITYDKEFKKFKEVRAMPPEDFLVAS